MNARTVLFWAAATFTLVAPTAIGVFFEDASTTWVAALSGAFVTILAKADDLSEIALGPVRAKIRRTLREANATIEQLRSLAATIARVTLTDLMSGSFMGGMQMGERLRLHDQVIDELRKLGVDDAQVRHAEGMWRKGIAMIYHRHIEAAIEQRKVRNSVEGVTPERLAIGQEFAKLLEFERWHVPTPADVRAFVERKNVADPEVLQTIDDYEHFIRTGELRRADWFAKW